MPKVPMAAAVGAEAAPAELDGASAAMAVAVSVVSGVSHALRISAVAANSVWRSRMVVSHRIGLFWYGKDKQFIGAGLSPDPQDWRLARNRCPGSPKESYSQRDPARLKR